MTQFQTELSRASPSNWSIESNDGTALVARNIVTGEKFRGTPNKFKSIFVNVVENSDASFTKAGSKPWQLKFPDSTEFNSLHAQAATALWAASKVSALNVISQALLTLGNPELQGIPIKTAPYQITGTTYYVDPTVTGPGAGTFADPYKAPSSVTLTAGDGILFKAGTGTTVAAAIVPAVTGTASNPIVYGVYDPVTGTRLFGQLGIAEVTVEGHAASAFTVNNLNYIGLEGLKIVGGSGTNPNVKVTGSSTNFQALNCYFSGGADKHLYINTTGAGHTVEGNYSLTATLDGIVLDIGAADSTSVLQFNFVKGAVRRSIVVTDSGNGFKFSGKVACNNCVDGSVSNDGGIVVNTDGGSLKLFRNTVLNCKKGLLLSSSLSSGTVTADFSGALIENNDFSRCEYNLEMVGVGGSWAVQYNRLTYAGVTVSGVELTSNKYGRNLYTHAAAAVGAVRGGTIRYNYCLGAATWHTESNDGLEGVGLCIDAYTSNVKVYGNYSTLNEGNGLRVVGGFCNEVYNNFVVNNQAATINKTVYSENPLYNAEIAISNCPYLQLYSNTVVNNINSSKFGICDSDTYPVLNGKVFSNFIIGATLAGVMRNTVAGGMVETLNVVINSPDLVVNTGGAAITVGEGTVPGTDDDYYKDIFFTPVAGGVATTANAAVSYRSLGVTGANVIVDTATITVVDIPANDPATQPIDNYGYTPPPDEGPA